MITTITLNPAIDRTIVVDECTLGKVHRIKSSREDIGGKGINVAKVINLLKGDTTAIGFLGYENKNKIEVFLHQEKIQADFIHIHDRTRVNTKVVDLKHRTTTEFNESGFRIHKDHIEQIRQKVQDYGKSSDYMIFSGSMPEGCPMGLYKELTALVKGDTRVVLDADGAVLREGVKASPFLIKPNIHELQNTFGIKVESIGDVVKGALDIVTTFRIQWVLVSLGKDGSILVSRNRILLAKPIKVDVKSSVGAGDSMLGGFIHSYSIEEDPMKALKDGTVCGTLAVTKEGTQLFNLEQVKAMQSKVIINDVSQHYLHD